MTEASRKSNNSAKINQLHRPLRVKVLAVLSDLEGHGYRPRIQEAYRTPADQLEDYNKGTSHLKFGFHNITYPTGLPASCAADIYNDDMPLADVPNHPFFLMLASSAESHGLVSGIYWGLKQNQRDIIKRAIEAKGWNTVYRVGFDPYHIQVDASSPTIYQAHVTQWYRANVDNES